MNTLFYTTRSFTEESTALITRIALEELGTPYTVAEVELSPTPPDWYLAINRHGQIPTLAMGPDGSAPFVAPSPATLLALADAHPDGGLLPKSAAARAACFACLLDMVETVHADFMRVFSPERYTTDPDGTDAVRAASYGRLGAYFSDKNRALSKQAHVAGATYTLCDIYFYVMVRWYADLGGDDAMPPFETLQALVAYCSRIEQREAVTSSLAKDAIRPIGG